MPPNVVLEAEAMFDVRVGVGCVEGGGGGPGEQTEERINEVGVRFSVVESGGEGGGVGGVGVLEFGVLT